METDEILSCLTVDIDGRVYATIQGQIFEVSTLEYIDMGLKYAPNKYHDDLLDIRNYMGKEYTDAAGTREDRS